jgi:spermidine synthase
MATREGDGVMPGGGPSSVGAHVAPVPAVRPAWFFGFFLVSGFCGLVYQVVWLRLAMAAFGVTAPMVSIVISVFMAGLALGSWGGGRLGEREGSRPGPLRLYAWTELAIATSGVLVPLALSWGREALARASERPAWGSLGHYLLSGAVVTLVLLPSCTCMGATFPLAMAAIRRNARAHSSRSFSYLYVANVVGACAGTLASSLVLIEVLGFRGTLVLTALLNVGLAVSALALSARAAPALRDAGRVTARAGVAPGLERRGAVLLALFTTGFSSMGMEVVWVRQLTPYLGTVVYAFALILALYLGATFAGSISYRRWGRRPMASAAPTWSPAWSWIGLLGLLSLASADPRLGNRGFMEGAARAALAIVPLCGGLGFFTPMLLDRRSGGDPGRAGAAYAVNMLGCILGPLVAGFILLPVVGERGATVVFAVPLLAIGLAGHAGAPALRVRTLAIAAALFVLVVASTRSYEDAFPRREVRRDYTATVVATGEGMDRQLFVNGVGMTRLTPITKLMAHLPLVHIEGTPHAGLAVCFGMGVTFRSLHSWGIETVAVELVPSVPTLFTYFHPGEEGLLHSPGTRIVVDDGRRFLERSSRRYDVITIDPPPPVTTAGSSLLYSRELCALARSRLRPDGILQQWLPAGDATIITAVTRALTESFPYVRAFSSIEGWGIHFLASERPIPRLTAAQAARRLPAAARADLLEWGPAATAEQELALVLRREIPVPGLLALDPRAPALSDDRPVNEYYVLRSLLRARRARRAAPP